MAMAMIKMPRTQNKMQIKINQTRDKCFSVDCWLLAAWGLKKVHDAYEKGKANNKENLNDLKQTAAQKTNNKEFVPDTSKFPPNPNVPPAPKYEPASRLGGGQNNPNTSQQQNNFTQPPTGEQSIFDTLTKLLPPSAQDLVNKGGVTQNR